MTRLEMEAVINGGGIVLWKGHRISTIEDLPTQDEIDAAYSTGDTAAVVLSVDAVGTSVEGIAAKMPAALDADGGFKVHLTNPDDIAGGGSSDIVEVSNLPALVDGGLPVTLLNPEDIGGVGGGGGLTDTELRATPVPVSVSNLPAVQPVNDNGGSLTVDGSVSVSNLPSTYPSTVADGADVAMGNTADAEATGNGTLIAIVKRLRTLFGAGLPAALGTGGGVKVDIVSGAGGTTAPSPVLAYNATVPLSAIGTTPILFDNISLAGYSGVRVWLQKTSGTTGMTAQPTLKEYLPDGVSVVTMATMPSATTNAGWSVTTIYPGVTVATGTYGNPPTQQIINAKFTNSFRLDVFFGGTSSGAAHDLKVWYQLLP